MKVFYTFRDTQQRRVMLDRLARGVAPGPGREQLFGFDDFRAAGLEMDCNLTSAPRQGMLESLVCMLNQWSVRRSGTGIGDVAGLLRHLREMNKCSVVVTTSDTTGMAALRINAYGLLRAQLVYISIGLSERMQQLSTRRPRYAQSYRKWLHRAGNIVSYGYAETLWLKEWLGHKVPVTFIPFGVDTAFWQRNANDVDQPKMFDVLSVGADPMRDFDLFVKYADAHPGIRCVLVAGNSHSAAFKCSLPKNLTLHQDIPVDQVRQLMGQSRVVVLPVKENSYSGATTTLLQAMAMGCAVAVSRVGAIRDGYGFEGDRHLCWIEPGNLDSLFSVVNRMLGDDDLCRALGVQGREFVMQNLTWEHFVKRLYAVFPKQNESDVR